MINSANYNGKTFNYNVSVLCMDIVDESKEATTDLFRGNDNEQDVLHTQEMVARRLLEMLNRGDLYDDGFQLSNGSANIEYFVVVKHRNHLTVSSVKLPLSQMGGATFINLSSNAAMYLQSGGTERYATEPLDLINSFFYMQYGNAHDEIGDIGEVNATDTFIVTQDQNQIFNLYVSTDLNLDGYVDTTDVAIVTEGEGALYYSGVPNPSLL